MALLVTPVVTRNRHHIFLLMSTPFPIGTTSESTRSSALVRA